MLIAKIQLVVIVPHSGVPELSSKMEPTEAIADIHAPNKHKPLKGV
jgi:hypothetical protein